MALNIVQTCYFLSINLGYIIYKIFYHGGHITYIPVEMIKETSIYSNEHVTSYRRMLIYS